MPSELELLASFTLWQELESTPRTASPSRLSTVFGHFSTWLRRHRQRRLWLAPVEDLPAANDDQWPRAA